MNKSATIKYGSIQKYRDAVYRVNHVCRFTGKCDENNQPIYDNSKSLDTINFRAYPKVDGTNGSVVFDAWLNKIQIQSRNNVLSEEKDNYGFYKWIHDKSRIDILKEYVREALENFPLDSDDRVVIYGEYCGKGIRPDVAIGQLPKMFIPFQIKILTNQYDPVSGLGQVLINPQNMPKLENHDANLFSINIFDTQELEIDFNESTKYPDILNEIAKKTVTECDIAKHFGVTGLGEGYVFYSMDPYFSDLMFKVKNEKFEVNYSPKIKQNAVEIDITAEKEFVEFVVTEARLKQGIEFIREKHNSLHGKFTYDFMQWVTDDVLKEESDIIQKNNLDKKVILKLINQKAAKFFKDYV